MAYLSKIKDSFFNAEIKCTNNFIPGLKILIGIIEKSPPKISKTNQVFTSQKSVKIDYIEQSLL